MGCCNFGRLAFRHLKVARCFVCNRILLVKVNGKKDGPDQCSLAADLGALLRACSALAGLHQEPAHSSSAAITFAYVFWVLKCAQAYLSKATPLSEETSSPGHKAYASLALPAALLIPSCFCVALCS